MMNWMSYCVHNDANIPNNQGLIVSNDSLRTSMTGYRTTTAVSLVKIVQQPTQVAYCSSYGVNNDPTHRLTCSHGQHENENKSCQCLRANIVRTFDVV